MHRVNRCTLAGTVWAPTSANRAPAHCYPLPGRPPCRAAARSTRPTIPRAPRPRIRPTARAPALRPLRLHRLRAAPGCPCPSMSPPSRSRAHRPPHRAHRAPTSASRPISLSSRCGGPRALTGKNRAVCIPFSPNARKRPPSWQHPPEMHAFRDQDGNILALCIHSRVQSGDLGYMARESCRQGPFSASRNPKSRMARRCCQRRPAFLRQQPAVRRNGLCALRRGPGLLAACPPCHLARVHRRRLTRVVLRCPHRAHRAQPSATPPIAVGVSRLSVSSCRPRAAHADASRHLRAASIPPGARTHRVQETSGTAQTTQCGHKNRIPKWGPY